ncbi:pleckstrin-2-like [Petromyzon marinus]|uniref:pleckstrin-2-like n=1 Tax=Petromyzon marinus TaxID=7757 RepID=UPI003F71465D
MNHKAERMRWRCELERACILLYKKQARVIRLSCCVCARACVCPLNGEQFGGSGLRDCPAASRGFQYGNRIGSAHRIRAELPTDSTRGEGQQHSQAGKLYGSNRRSNSSTTVPHLFQTISCASYVDEMAVTREGFLVKRGHVVHNWKARWFVLDSNQILYYRREGGGSPMSLKGSFPLQGVTVESPCLEFSNRTTVFKLQVPSKGSFYLQPSSREERDSWVADIHAALGSSVGGSPNSPPQSLTPSPQAHSPSLTGPNVNLAELVEKMKDTALGIASESHHEQSVTYRHCFTGASVVDWLLARGVAPSRNEAALLASMLLQGGLLEATSSRGRAAASLPDLAQRFLDGSDAFYCLSENNSKFGTELTAKEIISGISFSGKIILQGYLMKQGHRRRNWKVRKFILREEPSYLHYYDPTKERSERPLGGFPVRGCLVTALDDGGVPPGVRGNVQDNLFEVITADEVRFYLQAASAAQRSEWIRAIRQLS